MSTEMGLRQIGIRMGLAAGAALALLAIDLKIGKTEWPGKWVIVDALR